MIKFDVNKQHGKSTTALHLLSVRPCWLLSELWNSRGEESFLLSVVVTLRSQTHLSQTVQSDL